MDTIRIVVVEDEPIIAADLSDRLTTLGYTVVGPFEKGEEALAALESQNPDLVLMDIQLAGDIDGIETAKRLLEIKSIPIIFLTSNSDDKTFAQAKLVKPAAFLSKPFRGRDLQHAIELSITSFAEKSFAPATTDAAAPKNAEETYLLNDRLFVKSKGRLLRLFFDDILWAEADDYCCKIVTKEKTFLLSQSLSKFLETMGPIPEFLRVHRSYVVNLKHVDQIGELNLHIGNHEIPLSKNHRDTLLGRLKRV